MPQEIQHEHEYDSVVVALYNDKICNHPHVDCHNRHTLNRDNPLGSRCVLAPHHWKKEGQELCFCVCGQYFL